jgi:hypothetical protein
MGTAVSCPCTTPISSESLYETGSYMKQWATFCSPSDPPPCCSVGHNLFLLQPVSLDLIASKKMAFQQALKGSGYCSWCNLLPAWVLRSTFSFSISSISRYLVCCATVLGECCHFPAKWISPLNSCFKTLYFRE